MAMIKLTMEEYHRKLHSLPADQQDLVNGWSPGFVAVRLGISRSAVGQAIRRDRLKAYRIMRNGRMVATIIPEASVREYENSETRAKHTPKEYRAQA